MPIKITVAEIHIRTNKIREIAEGLFDGAERKAVLDLVKDYEKLALAKRR